MFKNMGRTYINYLEQQNRFLTVCPCHRNKDEDWKMIQVISRSTRFTVSQIVDAYAYHVYFDHPLNIDSIYDYLRKKHIPQNDIENSKHVTFFTKDELAKFQTVISQIGLSAREFHQSACNALTKTSGDKTCAKIQWEDEA